MNPKMREFIIRLKLSFNIIYMEPKKNGYRILLLPGIYAR